MSELEADEVGGFCSVRHFSELGPYVYVDPAVKTQETVATRVKNARSKKPKPACAGPLTRMSVAVRDLLCTCF